MYNSITENFYIRSTFFLIIFIKIWFHINIYSLILSLDPNVLKKMFTTFYHTNKKKICLFFSNNCQILTDFSNCNSPSAKLKEKKMSLIDSSTHAWEYILP